MVDSAVARGITPMLLSVADMVDDAAQPVVWTAKEAEGTERSSGFGGTLGN